MFQTVSVPFDAFQALPGATHRWLLTCFSRYVDKAGRACPSLRQLAVDARTSLASVSRYMTALERLGVFQRERQPGGRYRYVLAEAYRPRWPGRPKPGVSAPQGGGVSPVQGGVSQAAKQQAKPTSMEEERAREDLKWRARLRQRREFGRWVESFGPLPGQPGCRVPPHLLTEYGLAG